MRLSCDCNDTNPGTITRTHVCASLCVCMYVCIYIYIFILIHSLIQCIYIYIYICKYVCVCIYTHTQHNNICLSYPHLASPFIEKKPRLWGSLRASIFLLPKTSAPTNSGASRGKTSPFRGLGFSVSGLGFTAWALGGEGCRIRSGSKSHAKQDGAPQKGLRDEPVACVYVSLKWPPASSVDPR